MLVDNVGQEMPTEINFTKSNNYSTRKTWPHSPPFANRSYIFNGLAARGFISAMFFSKIRFFSKNMNKIDFREKRPNTEIILAIKVNLDYSYFVNNKYRHICRKTKVFL